MDSTLLTQLMGFFTSGATVVGGLIAVWGAIAIGTNLKNHDGPAIAQGVWQIIGGIIIISAAALFTTLV